MSTVKTYNLDSGDTTNLAIKTNGTTAITVSGSTQTTTIGNAETSATPTNGLVQATGGSGTNITGATLTIQGGRGTGSGAGGPVIISTAAAGSSGVTLNAATERARITPNGGVAFGGSTNYGTTGQKLVSNGDAAPTWGSAIVSDTAKASTSGTFIDFTGIPSWVKRITVMFNGVSTNGSSLLLVQLGTSGGVTTSGYVSSSGNIYGTNLTQITSSTAGFVQAASPITGGKNGHMWVTNVSGNIWVSSHSIGNVDPTVQCGGGTVTLSGALTQVRITTVNGTDTFDAGSINILYE